MENIVRLRPEETDDQRGPPWEVVAYCVDAPLRAWTERRGSAERALQS